MRSTSPRQQLRTDASHRSFDAPSRAVSSLEEPDAEREPDLDNDREQELDDDCERELDEDFDAADPELTREPAWEPDLFDDEEPLPERGDFWGDLDEFTDDSSA